MSVIYQRLKKIKKSPEDYYYYADAHLLGVGLDYMRMDWSDYDEKHGIKRRTSLTPLADDRN